MDWRAANVLCLTLPLCNTFLFYKILTYIITLVIMGLIDYGCTYGLIALGLGNLWSKGISSIIGVIGNFLLRKYFVWQERN